VLAAVVEEQATSSSTARGKRDAKEAIELSTTDQEFPEAGSFTALLLRMALRRTMRNWERSDAGRRREYGRYIAAPIATRSWWPMGFHRLCGKEYFEPALSIRK